MTVLVFASRYENVLSTPPEEFYEKGLFFNFAITSRNWTGETYIGREQVQSFIQSLVEHDQLLSPKMNTEDFIPFYYLLDTSVFASNDTEGNLKLIEFLEDLDDFYETENESVELQKQKNKYISKLRYFSSKPENLGYLYRWTIMNASHPFVPELEELIKQSFDSIQSAFHRKFSIHNLSEEEQERFSREDDKLAQLYSKKEEEIISKLTKFSYSEPSLFLFNAYFVGKWITFYKEASTIFKSYFTVTQFLDKKKVITDLYQGPTIHSGCYMYQEMMGNFMGLISDDPKWATANFSIVEAMEYEGAHEEVLKSIGKWAAKKIYKNKRHKLPDKRWFVDVTWDYLKEASIHQITFIRDKEVMGPNGKELIVYAKANMGYGRYIIYPLIDPANWSPLNAAQKALMTYTLCLYHDITVENAFNFENEAGSSQGPFINPYTSRAQKMVLEGVKAKSKINKVGQTLTQKSPHSKHKPHKEHWVTFHFRKLKEESEASPKAVEKAAKYDIEIPRGFTFIDSHVRGGDENSIEASQTKVSALDMFTKTIGKETV